MEDDDALGLLERRDQARVQEAALAPAVPAVEERRDHVGLDRAGAEQRDVDDEVVEPARPELADELALARALDLEHAQGAGGADQLVGGGVVVRHLRLVVEVDLLARDPRHLGDGVRHRRLHADAEHVELEEAQGLDVVLVELAHREADPARLDRGAVEQARVGQHDAARVQRDVPGQAVEGLDEVEEGGQAGAVEAAAAQLGQVGDGVPGVLGADVREGLGDLVDLGRRQPQRGADVAHRVAHLVGVHHRHAGDPLAAEAGRAPPRRSRCGGPTRRRRRCRAARRAAVSRTAP